MKIHKIKQGSDKWLKLRLGKFGSTDAQAIASQGRGMETKCYEKVAELITGELGYQYTNPDIERGNNLEDMARSAYEIATGNIVKQVGYVEVSDHVGGSPDGLVDDDGLIEIKCPNNINFVRFLDTRKIDSAYMWQMQHLIHITNRKWCDYVVFNEALDRIEVERVVADEKMVKKLEEGLEVGVKRLKKLWKKSLKKH